MQDRPRTGKGRARGGGAEEVVGLGERLLAALDHRLDAAERAVRVGVPAPCRAGRGQIDDARPVVHQRARAVGTLAVLERDELHGAGASSAASPVSPVRKKATRWRSVASMSFGSAAPPLSLPMRPPSAITNTMVPTTAW